MNRDTLMAMYDFTGKNFAVTGGSGALGGDVVMALANCGANVLIVDRNLARVSSIQDSLGPLGSHVEGCQADVLSRDSLMDSIHCMHQTFGPLYGLVNAAGGNSPKATVSPTMSFFDIPDEGLRFVLDLNLLGTIMACQIFGKDMVESGEGVILNYSSMAAYRSLTNVAAYSAAKAAITNFTGWLAVHMAQNYSGKIRVNAIAPGFFLGEQNRLPPDRQGHRRFDAARQESRRTYPHGPLWRPRRPAGHRALAALAGLLLRHRHHGAGGRGVLVVRRRLAHRMACAHAGAYPEGRTRRTHAPGNIPERIETNGERSSNRGVRRPDARRR